MSLAGKQVLFISYNGMLEPLGQSQVIPYLKELSKLGTQFTLLSYEREHAYREEGRQHCESLRTELRESGIDWHWLRYHKRPSIPATAFDVSAGVRFASRLVKSKQIELIHARSHIPALIALRLKRRLGVKMIFDVRGLMAEEYIDAGHWRSNGTPARLTKQMEARALGAADGVVTLTDALWSEMQGWPSLQRRPQVAHETIPCCIDLEAFRFDEQARIERRTELAVGDRFVLVYSGSIGGWYMTNEMAAFFSVLKRQRPDSFFLWLTQGDQLIVDNAMSAASISRDDYAVRSVAPRTIPTWLSASDAGIAFYRPGISRLGTSPIKISEYLACGLPVVVNAGVGDSDALISREKIGVAVRDFQDAEYAKAAHAIADFAAAPEEIRRRTRVVAETFFDLRQTGVERYARLYAHVLGSNN
jgi:glycosyltransferase involved in cell wall biosynthesis